MSFAHQKDICSKEIGLIAKNIKVKHILDSITTIGNRYDYRRIKRNFALILKSVFI
jgi:hypothetical protein